MDRRNFLDASLRPPAHDHQPPDEAGAPASCAVLDIRAYIAHRRNATTAYGRIINGHEIQVTFCVAPPPVTSYFCVWCPEPQNLTKLATEPRIIAAEADLVVLSVRLGSGFPMKAPWLRRLSREDNSYFGYFNLGLLRLVDDDDHYYVVSLSRTRVPWQFDLHIFDSKTETWSCRIASLGRQHQHSQFEHSATKVIMLGGGGLMGFVDPWRGILVCNVLDDDPMLHYMSFPRSLRDNKKLDLNPAVARDVVAVDGRIKVVECFCDAVSSSWKVSIWSRPSTSWEENWNRDCKLDICDNLVDNGTFNFELLSELQGNDDGTPLQRKRTLEWLQISHPRLSLNDDDVVYLMAKVQPRDKKACVLAVDFKNKRLQDVAVFLADRSRCDTMCYMNSSITKYFC
ncbi:unnamed protein product [Urochloa decumbens]|uniref:DUF1618 domain-containing protein n=1 Tax=Urochloa decumbens TaxID=240449 RepID=A0ABC9CS85_9POAL